MGFSSPPQSVLILKPSSLGDIIHALPAVAALKAHWPDTKIDWLVNTEWMPLLAGNPDIERIIEFPRKQFRGVRGWLSIPSWLVANSGKIHDLALDLQGLLRSGLIARWLGSSQVWGLSDAREGVQFFYHRTVKLPSRRMHAVDRYMCLVRALHVEDLPEPVFRLPAGSPPEGFYVNEPYVVLHPFSRGKGKSLSPACVEQIAMDLAPQKIVLAGTFDEPLTMPDNVINVINRTSLSELIWLIRNAAFTVSVDSGPAHIAAALSNRLLSIHTWSNPQLVGPYRPDAWIWKSGRIMKVADWKPGHSETISPPSPDRIAMFVKEWLVSKV